MNCTILVCPPMKTCDIYAEAKTQAPGRYWTPIFTRMRRLPRSRKKVLSKSAALPGYLFVQGEMETIPLFLIRHGVKFLTRADGYLATCTMAEIKGFHQMLSGRSDKVTVEAPQPAAIPEIPVFPVGTMVRVYGENHFLSGLKGTVVCQKDEYVTVESEEIWGTLKISSFLLAQA